MGLFQAFEYLLLVALEFSRLTIFSPDPHDLLPNHLVFLLADSSPLLRCDQIRSCFDAFLVSLNLYSTLLQGFELAPILPLPRLHELSRLRSDSCGVHASNLAPLEPSVPYLLDD